MKKIGLAGILMLFLLVVLNSCSEKGVSVSNPAKLQVRLTDDPAGFDEVNIDIRDVQFNVTGDSSNGWQSLSTIHPGIYNLLDLVNDKDTLLGESDIPSGRLHQLRLVLGPDNSIIVNGISYPLQTPSAQQSGLKLNIQQDVMSGILYTIQLDFDASKSIVKTGNSKYILKPVIRTVLQAAGGSIKGNVQPDSVKTSVLAIQGTDTVAGTFSASNGDYFIKGIPAGAYSLHYLPTDTTFKKEMRDGIVVITGKVTMVDTVKLSK